MIRPAAAADAALYAQLFPALALDEPTPGPGRIAQLLPDMLVDDDARGFVVAAKEGDVGFVRQIVVAPGARRAGVGRALMAAAADRLRSRGVREWRLNVKVDNAGAIALYESVGMRVAYGSHALWISREAHLALPCSRAPIVVATPADADLRSLEARFHLPDAHLARPWHDTHVRIARPPTGTHALGLMRFAPSFPGAYPFFADDAGTARALIGAAFALAPATAARIGLVIERHDELADRLVEAGAELRFRMLQLRGSLDAA